MASKSKRERHESPEVGAMARRMVRALVRRAAEGDTEALEELARLERELPKAITVAGQLMASGERMANNQSYSYTELGNTLGITRQAARQRFCKPASGPTAVYYAGLPRGAVRAGMEVVL